MLHAPSTLLLVLAALVGTSDAFGVGLAVHRPLSRCAAPVMVAVEEEEAAAEAEDEAVARARAIRAAYEAGVAAKQAEKLAAEQEAAEQAEARRLQFEALEQAEGYVRPVRSVAVEPEPEPEPEEIAPPPKKKPVNGLDNLVNLFQFGPKSSPEAQEAASAKAAAAKEDHAMILIEYHDRS